MIKEYYPFYKEESPGTKWYNKDISPTLKEGVRLAGKGAAGTVKGLYKGAEAISEGRSIIPTSLKSFFGKLFGFFLRIFFALLILAIVTGTIIMGFNFFGTGVVGTGATHAQVAGREAGLPLLQKIGIRDAYLAVFQPEKLLVQSSFESDIENTGNRRLGVAIKSLEQIGKVFSGEDITVTGTIEVESLPDTIDIQVYCTLEDYQDGSPILAEISLPGTVSGTATIHKGIREVFQATCTFPKGIEITGSKQVITSKKASMFVAYDFETIASHKTYILDSEEMRKFTNQNKDPFNYYGVSDPQLTAKRTIRSKATPGPINLGIGTFQSQPFVQNTPYWFGVTVSNNLDWRGNLKRLNKVELQIPDYLTLESDREFGSRENARCDFITTGELIQDGDLRYKLYVLRDEILNDEEKGINKDCSVKSLKDTTLTRDVCIDLFQKDLDFRCRFKIKEEMVSPTLTYDAIGAKAGYIYETEKQMAVNIYKIPAV